MKFKNLIIILIVIIVLILAVIIVRNINNNSESSSTSTSDKIDDGTVINQDKGYDENNPNIENIQIVDGEEGSYFVDEDGIRILNYNE